ncbi:MAG: conjugal transfer protein TraH [Desulfobacteraceae bacterium]|nr:conjugal transfer protein TraH [Desulfobacteraceae bacterium]
MMVLPAYTIFSNNHKAILIFWVVFSLITSKTAHAAWIDDWIDQKTTTQADYFTGQKRGYGTLGSFSARWSSGNDYLLNVTPPKFKAGCGGIDVFMGGFSFLNADYLVQKLQNMMNAAPAVAFDIALNTLCSQCAKSLNTLEAITDRLNQLQLDDCKATKALVYEVADGLTSGPSSDLISAKKTMAVQDFVQSTGVMDLYTAIKTTGGNDKNTTAGALQAIAGVSENAQISACPVAIKALFFTNGSILSNLLATRGLSASYADLMRGYIGDIMIDGATLTPQYVAKCPKDTPNNIDGLVNGEVWTRPINSQCVKMTSITINGAAYPNVREWIFTVLQSIATKMIAKQALTVAEENFVKILPMPIYNSIVGDVAAQGAGANPTSIADIYADVVASAYAYVMMTDLYDTIQTVIDTGDVIVANSQGSANATQQNLCHIELASPTIAELKKMKNALPEYVRAARNQYSAKLTELVGYQEYDARADETKNQIYASLARYFNAGVAHRLTR